MTKTMSEMKLERCMPAKATHACKECGAEYEMDFTPARCICGAWGSMILIDKKGDSMKKPAKKEEPKLLALRLPVSLYNALKMRAEEECRTVPSRAIYLLKEKLEA